MATNGGKPLVQSSDEVEDEGAVADWFTKISEVVGSGLEKLAVVGDREFGIEDEGPRLSVAEKLALDGKPDGAGSDTLVAAMPDDVEEVVGEGAVEPRTDDAGHALPVRRVQGTIVVKDMTLKRILAQREQELRAPPSEVAGVDVEDDVDKAADILDGHSLGVEVQNSGSLLKNHGRVDGRSRAIGEGRRVLFCVFRRSGGALQGGADARGSSVALDGRGTGLSLGLLRAMRSNSGERWARRRIDRYGAVSKLSLFGKPTVLVAGAAANRFVFFSGALALQQPRSVQRILGDRSILDLVGADHRRVRGALSEFLRPEMLRMYVGKIDGEARRHVAGCWSGRAAVTVMPLMKRLTFDIIASLLFGLGPGAAARDALAGDFERVMGGMWAVPVDLPFTAFRRSLRAAARARRLLAGITRERKAALERGAATRSSDLIACLLSLTDDRGGAPLLSEEEIVDTAMVALVAGHDTSSILMTFMVRHLANDPDTLAAMVQGKKLTLSHITISICPRSNPP